MFNHQAMVIHKQSVSVAEQSPQGADKKVKCQKKAKVKKKKILQTQSHKIHQEK